MSRKSLLSISLVVILFAGAAFYLLRETGTGQQATHPSLVGGAAKSVASAVGTVSQAQPQLPSPTKVGTPQKSLNTSEQLQIDLRDTRDLRAVFNKYKTLATDKDDVTYHLWFTARRCAALFQASDLQQRQAQIQKKEWQASDKELALAMLNKHYERCAGFSTSPVDQAELDEMRASMARSSAPASTIFAYSLNHRDPKGESFNREVSAAILSGDPYALEHMTGLVMENEALRRAQEIDGRPIYRGTIGAAWRMVACDLGANCMEEVERTCASIGRCAYSNYEDMVRSSILSPAEFEAAQRLRERIRRAIDERNPRLLGFN